MLKYKKKVKDTQGFGYWGDFGDIDMGFSSGLIKNNHLFPGEKLHYHTKGTMYFLIMDGIGEVEVDGVKVLMEKNALYRVDPGEKYRVLGAKKTPFSWICICTSKDPKEKIVLD